MMVVKFILYCLYEDIEKIHNFMLLYYSDCLDT